jgi:hypothetical protein
MFFYLSNNRLCLFMFTGFACTLTYCKIGITMARFSRRAIYLILWFFSIRFALTCVVYVLRHLVIGMISLWSVPNRLVPLKQHWPVVSWASHFRVLGRVSVRRTLWLLHTLCTIIIIFWNSGWSAIKDINLWLWW